MKLFLASFLEPQNFGKGRIIGIEVSNKPKFLDVQFKFEQFIPSVEIIESYYDSLPKNPDSAGKTFECKYAEQLDNFYNLLQMLSEDAQKPMVDFLPFKDGDTLASWQREKNHNYRKTLAPILEKIGYEVELH
jgi:hypothetical protein